MAPHVDDVVVPDPAGEQLLAVGRHQVDEPVPGAVGPRHGVVEGGGPTASAKACRTSSETW